MDVESLGSLPVGSLWWRLGDGPWTLSVVCRGTLDLTPGELRLAARQDPIAAQDQFMGGNRNASLYQPTDLLPYKPRVDVGLVGCAYAPEGTTVESLTARLCVGELDKSITVMGEEGGSGAAHKPFASAPLSYELAAGGPATLNPVGASPTPGAPRPRLLPATAQSLRPGMDLPTAGFGPIAPQWPGRRRLLHGKTAPVQSQSGGELSLPGDFDLRYFNTAPADQQLRELLPGAAVLIEGVHPQHPVLRTRLPRMSPQVFVLRTDGERREQVAAIDTLWIDTQRMVATITWRAVLEIGRRGDCRKVWVVITEAGKRLSWEKLSKLVDTLGVPMGQPQASLRSAMASSGTGIDGRGVAARWAPPSHEGLRAVDEHALDGNGDRMNDTMAIPERLPRPKDEDTLSEVTASVLIDRFAQPVPQGNGVPAWLTRAANAPGTPPGSRVPTPPPPTAAQRTSSPGMAAAALLPLPAPPLPAAPPQPMDASALRPAPPAPMDASALRPLPPLPATAAADPGALRPSNPAALPAEAPAPVPSASPVPGPSGIVHPPQPSWVAMGGTREEQRHPWEDKSDPPRVMSSLKQPTAGAGTKRDVVELLWFDPQATKRVRQRWRSLTDELDFAPIDDRHDLPSDDPQLARDRHTHFGVLTEAPITEPFELGTVVREAISDSGRFTPPLIVVAGRLLFPFDDLEILRATSAALTPLAGDDKRLKEALGNVKELLDTPLLQHSNELVDNFTKHLRSLYDQSKRAVSRDYLETSVERLLLEQRRYQKRPIFDGSWIRALLSPPSGGESVPTYLPETLEKTLPMMVAFKARMIVQAHVKQDQYEAHQHALRVVALGRVLDIER